VFTACYCVFGSQLFILYTDYSLMYFSSEFTLCLFLYILRNYHYYFLLNDFIVALFVVVNVYALYTNKLCYLVEKYI